MEALLISLQPIVDSALREVCGSQADAAGLRVRGFGSRIYGAAGANSDFDFCLELPPAIACQAKVIRAAVRQKLVNSGFAKFNDTYDAPDKSTLS